MGRKWNKWKVEEVVKQVVNTVERLGFGITYGHEEMDSLLGLKRPVEGITEYNDYQLKKILLVGELSKKLLRDHKIYLTSVRSVGYTVLHPKDQVSIGYDKCIKDMRKELGKASRCINNVQTAFLTDEEKKIMDANKIRTAFIRGAMGVKM